VFLVLIMLGYCTIALDIVTFINVDVIVLCPYRQQCALIIHLYTKDLGIGGRILLPIVVLGYILACFRRFVQMFTFTINALEYINFVGIIQCQKLVFNVRENNCLCTDGPSLFFLVFEFFFLGRRMILKKKFLLLSDINNSKGNNKHEIAKKGGR
jgi:hypothetical protein